MKKILILILATALIYSANAQQFSGGFRTGASYWMNNQEGKSAITSARGQHLTWDKEIFVRYSTKGKFAFEVAMGHCAFNRQTVHEDWVCILDENNIATMSVNTETQSAQNIDWNFSVLYRLTSPALQDKYPFLKKMKNYIGLSAAPSFSRITSRGYSYDGEVLGQHTADSWTVWTGLVHTLVYNLSNQMYVTSTMRMQIHPTDFFSSMEPAASYVRDSRLGLQIGVGYNLR